jgi:DNA-binding Xre family transcriptional regulator
VLIERGYLGAVAWTAGDRERWQPDVQRGWEIVGAMVKRRRDILGWSQRELQRQSGLTQSAISRLENGKLSGLRFARFARIVAAMNGLDPGAPHPTNKGLRVIAQLFRD